MGEQKEPEKAPSKKSYGTLDNESQEEEKIPYPKSVLLIIATEFCERFSYFGMRTVLSLYFKFLKFDESTATVLFHSFVSLCYFAPILGATLADSFLGKFRTIFYLAIIYIIGELVLTLGAVGDTSDGNEGIEGMPAAAVSFIGLFLIAIGTGGIKPCVAPFGAEQFELPKQEDQMKTYFSWFYAAVNSGAMISSILTPYMRNSPCLGQETCFPLAFGIPSALMVVALGFFVLGRVFNLYKNRMPDENIIFKTVGCIWHGFKEWRNRRKNEKLGSMLDYARSKYGDSFVDDVKALQGVIYVFLPVPVFWSLFDQQGSSWTFQATRMKSRVGESFELLPDTIQVANAILILIFIPFFEYVIYPLLNKVRLCRTPLQRIVTGGCLAGIAFLVSGFIELKLQDRYPVLPGAGELELSFYNGLSDKCDEPIFTMTYNDPGSQTMKTFEIDFSKFTKYEDDPDRERRYVVTSRFPNVNFTIKETSVKCNEKEIKFDMTHFGPFDEPDEKPDENVADRARTILFTLDATGSREGVIYYGEFPDKYDKPSTGFPFLKIFWNVDVANNATIEVMNEDDKGFTIEADNIEASGRKEDDYFKLNTTIGDFKSQELPDTGKFDISLKVDGHNTDGPITYDFFYGGNYQFVVQHSGDVTINVYLRKNMDAIITEPNSLHMLWQMPQYIVLTAAEIMFSITTLSFAYTEAPVSMKSVIMAVQNLTVAFGDIIVIIFIPILAALFDKQAYAFFFFSGLMFVDMALMAWMTRNYEYKDKTNRAISNS